MLRRKLFAVLVTLTLVFTLTPLSAFAEEVMDGTSPPAQLEAAEQTGELLIGEEPEGDNGSGADEGTATDEVPDVPIQYKVIIHYVDENGNKLREDYVGEYAPGSEFAIDSPLIEGYTPAVKKIVNGDGGMPNEELEYTVTYSKTAPAPGTTPSTDAKPDKAAPKATVAAVSKAALTNADTRSYEITVIGEEKTPLAGGFLDSDCCILHLLIMLLATAVLIWYTRDMRKRQERIFELED